MEGYVQIVLTVVIGPLMDIDVIYSKKKLHVNWGKTQPHQSVSELGLILIKEKETVQRV